MNISSIGATTNPYQDYSANGFKQLFKDFKSMAGDIQSGDLTDAQSALTDFEKDLQSNSGQNPLSQLFSNNSTLSNDLSALQTALQSNNSTSAQSAFQNLIQDMQGAMGTHGAHHGHHHHHLDNDGDGNAQSFGLIPTTSGIATNSAAASATPGSTLNVQA